jgi:RNA polymerase sigma-70 factor (ECF subfamily)
VEATNRRSDSGRRHAVTDAELIARILRGDPLAERALYDRHADAVYRVAYRVCGDGDAAADCAQETFVRAFKSLERYRGDAPFTAWLRTIALRVVCSHTQKYARFVGSDALDGMADTRDESMHATMGLTDRVAATLTKMSEKLRTVFLLYDVEGFSHEEISSALGIPVGTSKARLSEARAKLRVALRDFAEGANG